MSDLEERLKEFFNNFDIVTQEKMQTLFDNLLKEFSTCQECGYGKVFDYICEKCGYDNKLEGQDIAKSFLKELCILSNITFDEAYAFMMMALHKAKNDDEK